MKKLRTILSLFLLLGLGTQLSFAQNEKESVDQYRDVAEFRGPVVTAPLVDDSSETAVENAGMVSPDSFGVYYNAPAALFGMINLHRDVNNEIEYTKGFRIQIYAGSSLELANDAKADFLQSIDDDNCPVYQIWNPPHFRVRVGDFLSRGAAMSKVANIRGIFPDAFIVSDEVKVPKFKNRKKEESAEG